MDWHSLSFLIILPNTAARSVFYLPVFPEIHKK
jgi:hypothetical protein